jgi:putative redox protein
VSKVLKVTGQYKHNFIDIIHFYLLTLSTLIISNFSNLKMTDKIVTHWQGGMTFESDNPSGKRVVMDTDIEGEEERFGLSPKAMMLSSLAGCSALDVISILDKMNEDIDDFKIEVAGHLTDEHPKYYHSVAVAYHFYGSDLSKKKCERAVELSVEKYCGVMEMFRRFADVKIEIIYHIGDKRNI